MALTEWTNDQVRTNNTYTLEQVATKEWKGFVFKNYSKISPPSFLKHPLRDQYQILKIVHRNTVKTTDRNVRGNTDRKRDRNIDRNTDKKVSKKGQKTIWEQREKHRWNTAKYI